MGATVWIIVGGVTLVMVVLTIAGLIVWFCGSAAIDTINNAHD
jgi:Na+-transporting methylmalonyl-CoA/oxaloacetate decarboxylase gamma subunit